MYVLCLNYSTCIFTVLLINTDFTKSSNGFVENRMETEMIISNIIGLGSSGLKEWIMKNTVRVATAQGKQGIWFLLFPDRENTGNFVLTQGKIC